MGILFCAGCALPLHIGKMPVALPFLKDEFGLSLTATGAIVGMYALLSALSALLFGLLVARVGYVTFAVSGIALSGIGSLLGAAADNYWWLLGSRALEGAGWILAVLALPALLSTLSSDSDRPLIMGIWGSFVPVGAGLMLFASPMLLSMGGWRFSWITAGFSCLVMAVCVAVVCRLNQAGLEKLKVRPAQAPMFELKRPAVWLLAACFMIYSFQFLSVTAFFPTMLSEKSNLSVGTISLWTALIIFSNAVGNIAGGWLIGRGIRRDYLLMITALLTGILALLVYSNFTPVFVRIMAAILFSMLGGIIPGVAWATVPVVASSAASVGLLVAVLLQGMGVGQLFGPIVLPAVVESSGGNWMAGGYMMLVVSVLGAWFAYALGRRLPIQ